MNSVFAGGNDNGNNCKTWYVKFGGDDNASGMTKTKPFGTLSKVAAVSKECDTIKILPGNAPLDGGIVLKNKQKLLGVNENDDNDIEKNLAQKPQITNSASGGNAVVLANNNDISNIHIIFVGNPNDPSTIPAGSGIFGDNVTGANIKCVKVSKVNPINSAALDASLCQWVRLDSNNPFSAVDNDASTFRGCKLNDTPLQMQSAAILFLSGDNNKNIHPSFSHQLKDIEIVDARPGDLHLPTSTNKVWLGGIVTVDSGNVKVTVNVDNATIRNTQWGFQNYVYDKATLHLNLQNTFVADTFNDSIEFTTGFFCSGIPGLEGCSLEPAPVSDPTVVLNVKKHNTAYDIAAPAPNNSQGIEIVENDVNLGTLIVHVEKSSLVHYNRGFLYTIGSDISQPKYSLFDLGCVNPDPSSTNKKNKTCKEQGYTSKGLNRFISNVTGDVIVQGSGIKILAQNDYYNGLTATSCISPDNPDELPACLIDFDPLQNDSIDNRFFLLIDPGL